MPMLCSTCTLPPAWLSAPLLTISVWFPFKGELQRGELWEQKSAWFGAARPQAQLALSVEGLCSVLWLRAQLAPGPQEQDIFKYCC